MESNHRSISSYNYSQNIQTPPKTSLLPTILIPFTGLKYSLVHEKPSILLPEPEMNKKEVKISPKLPESRYMKRRYSEFGVFGSSMSKQIEQSPKKHTCLRIEDHPKSEAGRNEAEEAVGYVYSFTESKMDYTIDQDYPENMQEYIFSTIGKESDQKIRCMRKTVQETQYSFSECSSTTPINPLYTDSTIYTFSKCLFYVC